MSLGISKPILERLPENNRLERIWKLAQIDFMKRYYNDRLGLVWALLNPGFRILVYYIVFTQMFKGNEANYVLFLASGILFWGVFAEISKGGMSVIATKIYLIENIQFDKFDIFVSHAISIFMAFLFNLSVYLLLAIVLNANLNWNVLFIIPLLFNMFLLAIAASMILSTLVLYIDDVRHLWDMLLFVGFWGSGVIVKMDPLIESAPYLNFLNPFIPLLKNCRNALIDGIPPDFGTFFYCLLIGFFSFGIAVKVFRRNEHLILEKL